MHSYVHHLSVEAGRDDFTINCDSAAEMLAML